jgi:hypothetical protein
MIGVAVALLIQSSKNWKYDAAVSRRQNARVLGLVMSLREYKGAGKTGCWLHPRARLQIKKQAVVTAGSTGSTGLPARRIGVEPAHEFRLLAQAVLPRARPAWDEETGSSG